MTNNSTDKEKTPISEGQSILARIRNYARVHDAILVTNDGKLLRHPVVMTSPFPIHFDIEDEIR